MNLINSQPDIDKIYLYAKDLYEAKYQYLINKREKVGLINMMILKLLLNTQLQDVYKNYLRIQFRKET